MFHLTNLTHSLKRLIWKVLGGTLLLSLLIYTIALAAAGDLDTTFSGDGKLTTDISGNSNNSAWGVAINAGKIIVVGEHGGAGADFAVVRYLATDGALDTSFSGDGKVLTDFGDFERARGVAVQSDGKIVVVGETCDGSWVCDLAVARYRVSGALDGTFDGDGKVEIDFGGGNNGTLKGVVIQPDGKIVIAGYMYNGSNYDFAVYRLNSDGSLDNTFSGDGRAQIAFASGRNDTGVDLVLVSSKIVVAGYTCDGSGENCNMAVLRLNANGTQDTSFSSDGWAVANFGGEDRGWAIAAQTDDKIVVAGRKKTADDTYFALARFNTNGTLDTTFSSDGKVTTNLTSVQWDDANAITIQANGRILVAGTTGVSAAKDFALVRYRSNGALDTSFSGDGIVTTHFYSDEYAFGMALHSNGKILVVGRAEVSPSDWDFALARYLP
jgi:uncharacterized delta-60 repeat protein